MGRGRDWLGEREGLVSGEDSHGGERVGEKCSG